MPSNTPKANSQVQEAVTEILKQVKYEPVKPSAIRTVEIELDKVRHLRMSLGAMKIIEEKTGENPWAGSSWNFNDTNKLAIFLWACLRHEDPELSIEQVLELPGTELANVPYIIDRLSMLWGFSMPEPSDETVGEEKDPN